MNQPTRTRTAPAEVREPSARPAPAPVREPLPGGRFAVRVPPGPVPAAPSWSERLLPRPVRELLADLGWWTNPTPQPPSRHLLQVRDTLTRYGWCQTADLSPTGRMCIRGAQHLLERTGHVTPTARTRAVGYLEQVLRTDGVQMSFFAWNDLPDNTPDTVIRVLDQAANLAARNGD